jgi:fibronectin type 3 domain-containing protein
VALQITLPSIPTGLSASDGTFNDRVALTWQPSDNATGYRVSRGLAVPGAWYMEIGTSTVPQYEDTTVEQGKTFSYMVKAYNALFESNNSEADTGYASIPIALPETPTSLTASDGDFHDKIVLNWSDAINALYYKIYRGVNWNDMILFSLIDDTVNTVYTDTGVYPRTTYTYSVTAANGFGESDFSEYDTGFLKDCPGNFDFDGDIDGKDLSLYIESGGIDVEVFAGHYGRIDCP